MQKKIIIIVTALMVALQINLTVVQMIAASENEMIINEETFIDDPEIEGLSSDEDISGISDIIDNPEATEIPDITDITDAVEDPDTTDIPDVVENPEATDIADVVENPETADIPDIIENPEITGIPGVTEIPDITKVPDISENSNIPDISEATFESNITDSSDSTETSEDIAKKDKPVIRPRVDVRIMCGKIKIKKQDAFTGEPLSGAEFVVIPWNQNKGEYEDSLGANRKMLYDDVEKCYYSIILELSDDNYGKFKVIEERNPEGYTGQFEREIAFSPFYEGDMEIIEITAENTPAKLPCGVLEIHKKIMERDIHWSHGNPVFHFIVEGTDHQGKYHKYEDYIEFSEGTYQIDENGYANKKLIFSNIPIGTYTVYEKNGLRYGTSKITAKSNNISVSNESKKANVNLDQETLYGQLEFINKHQRYDKLSFCDVVKNTISINWN